jgi:hypothetical protein
MGQQQILLIVIGVIVVAIAVVGGISIFSASHDDSIKDELVTQCLAIGVNAQQFFLKPAGMGGGNNTYNTGGPGNAGYVIPGKMLSTNNGDYTIITKADTSIILQGTPKQINGKSYSFQYVQCTVGTTSIITTIY